MVIIKKHDDEKYFGIHKYVLFTIAILTLISLIWNFASAYTLQFTGKPYERRFARLEGNVGELSENCVKYDAGLLSIKMMESDIDKIKIQRNEFEKNLEARLTQIEVYLKILVDQHRSK